MGKSERKQDQKFSWLKGDKGTPPKNTTKDDADGLKCPLTKGYSCPADPEAARGCSAC